MTREVVAVLIATTKKFMDEADVQVVCCGTISYLSSSGKANLLNKFNKFFQQYKTAFRT